MDTDHRVPDHVLDAYGIGDADIVTLSGGRTNRTLRVLAGRDLVLQQLRSIGGSDLLGIMENLVRVTSHLDWKHRTAGSHGDGTVASSTWWPELVSTSAGKVFLVDDQGSVWRAFRYRKGRVGRPTLPMDSLASAAELFGRFSQVTADLDGPELLVTAPGFHELDGIWFDFHEQLDAADADTAAPVRAMHERLQGVKAKLESRIGDDGLADVPQRVVHNDTKISNVLLHETSSDAIAVLDLDLVMMGPIWHDVGDLIRSISWHVDHAGPTLSPQLFDTVAAAFVRGAGATLTDGEVATFAAAGPRLAFELGVRYLRGHLQPENALRVDGDLGRFNRGVANVNLAEEMLNAYDALRFVVDDLIARR